MMTLAELSKLLKRSDRLEKRFRVAQALDYQMPEKELKELETLRTIRVGSFDLAENKIEIKIPETL